MIVIRRPRGLRACCARVAAVLMHMCIMYSICVYIYIYIHIYDTYIICIYTHGGFCFAPAIEHMCVLIVLGGSNPKVSPSSRMPSVSAMPGLWTKWKPPYVYAHVGIACPTPECYINISYLDLWALRARNHHAASFQNLVPKEEDAFDREGARVRATVWKG